MKKFFLQTAAVFSVLFFTCTSASALIDNDKPITLNDLPQSALTTITQNFVKRNVTLTVLETDLLDKSYNVYFKNGDKVEFDRKGNWTEVVCKTEGVPAALVPQAITDYVKSNHPDTKIVKIERENNTYEVNLSNGIEYTFNKKFKVVDVDR